MAQLQIVLLVALSFNANLQVNSEEVVSVPPEIEPTSPSFKVDPEITYKITGGTTAQRGVYPFMASLQEAGSHFCGGSIFSSKYILSAAHCFDAQKISRSNLYYLSALVGTNDLDARNGVKHAFKQVIIHAQFNTKTVANDIALIKLETVIRFNDFTKPVVLDTSYINPGTPVTTVGWGRVSANGNISRVIRYVDLATMDTRSCDRTFSAPVTESQVCVTSPVGKGACKGDSGGALIANNKQIGITSFGGECGSGLPEVYTRISAYYAWIQQNAK